MILRIWTGPFILLLALSFSSAPAFAAQKVRRNVEVEWEGVEDASLYEVKVVRKDGSSKKPQTFKMKESKWSATIAPGLYLMQIRSYDVRGVPGDWSPASELEVKLPAIIVTSPEPGQQLEAKDEKSESLDLKWEAIPGAAHYKVTVKSSAGDWKEEREVEDTSAEFNVPVGQNIEWNVVAVDPKGIDGESTSEPYKFEFKGPPLAKPKLERPMSKYVKEVKWQAPSYATKYSYDLQYLNRKTRKWETVETKKDYAESKIDMDISRPSGRYRLVVQAHADHRKDSPKVQMDFDSRGGFRDPASFDHAVLRDSLTKPTDFYVIASYLISQISFRGANYDANSQPTFKALGGTGRVGGGYQNPESNWGGFGIADLSGFIIKGQNYKFASVEGHVTRKLELGQAGILLAATGLFAKELPVLQGTNVDGFASTDKVRNIGPHGGFTYWYPLSDRFGIQANARMYYTLLGTTSSGKKAKSSMSYQYGLLGSYRLSKTWMGYAGYAFRRDEARYETYDDLRLSYAPGETNSVVIEGHYLNLILEFSF